MRTSTVWYMYCVLCSTPLSLTGAQQALSATAGAAAPGAAVPSATALSTAVLRATVGCAAASVIPEQQKSELVAHMPADNFHPLALLPSLCDNKEITQVTFSSDDNLAFLWLGKDEPPFPCAIRSLSNIEHTIAYIPRFINGQRVTELTLSPDNQLFSLCLGQFLPGYDNHFYVIRRLATPEQDIISNIDGKTIQEVTFSPCGNIVLLKLQDAPGISIALLSPHNFQIISRIDGKTIMQAEFSPDKTLVALKIGDEIESSYVLRKTSDLTQDFISQINDQPITKVQFSSHGTLMVCMLANDTLVMGQTSDAHTFVPLPQKIGGHQVKEVQLSSDGQLIVLQAIEGMGFMSRPKRSSLCIVHQEPSLSFLQISQINEQDIVRSTLTDATKTVALQLADDSWVLRRMADAERGPDIAHLPALLIGEAKITDCQNIQLSPDNQLIAAEVQEGYNQCYTRLIVHKTQSPDITFEIADHDIRIAQFSPDSTLVAFGLRLILPHQFVIRAAADLTRDLLVQVNCQKIKNVIFTPDHQLVLLQTINGTYVIRKLSDIDHDTISKIDGQNIKDITLSPDGRVAALLLEKDTECESLHSYVIHHMPRAEHTALALGNNVSIQKIFLSPHHQHIALQLSDKSWVIGSFCAAAFQEQYHLIAQREQPSLRVPREISDPETIQLREQVQNAEAERTQLLANIKTWQRHAMFTRYTVTAALIAYITLQGLQAYFG